MAGQIGPPQRELAVVAQVARREAADSAGLEGLGEGLDETFTVAGAVFTLVLEADDPDADEPVAHGEDLIDRARGEVAGALLQRGEPVDERVEANPGAVNK